MSITTTTHLNLRGDARAALEHYSSAFGGHVVAVTYRDAHRVEDPLEADWVMWGEARSETGFHVMAYDVPSSRPWSRGQDPFFVSVRGTDAAELTSYWEKLSEGATVVVPLAPAAWSPLYGMLTDRFGVTWVLDVEVQYDPAAQ